MSVKLGAVPSSMKVDRIQASVFNEVEDFEILTVEKTESLHF